MVLKGRGCPSSDRDGDEGAAHGRGFRTTENRGIRDNMEDFR
jgi:hypothetical protein